MSKYKIEVNPASEHENQTNCTEAQHDANADSHESKPNGEDFTTKAATVGAVVVGAALLETALIPGILLGAAAVLAPKYLPKLGERLQPMFHATVRGAYKLGRKARSAVGEVQEHMSDIAAEVHAEEFTKASETATVESVKS